MKKFEELVLKMDEYREESSLNNSIISVGNIQLIKFPRLSEIEGLNHCFTTRGGGVSVGCCDSLNLSFGREGNVENVQENYRRLMKAYGEDERKAAFTNQDHTKNIVEIKEGDSRFYGPWVFDGEPLDGMVTEETGITLFTYYGDCVPVYLVDKKNRKIGLVHSGWRGTVINAGGACVEKMTVTFGTQPEELIAVVGPSIGPDCFQVDWDVAQEFLRAFGEEAEVIYEDSVPKKYKVDLWEANRLNLIHAGIKAENIVISGLCTCCEEELFFSHRRDHGKTGSMAALLTLR